VWQRDVGWGLVGGPAAWRDDTHLAVLRRDLSGDQAASYDPSNWTLEFVDPATGNTVAGPGYPVLGGAFGLQIVAWRGETAYAVARFGAIGRDQNRTALVRLDPGTSSVRQVVTAPIGVRDLGVATNYVDAVRDAGTPEFGFNPWQAASMAVSILEPAAFVAL